MTNETELSGWRSKFDARQHLQIKLSRLYAADFHHGADGHNNMMIISQMEKVLDELEADVKRLKNEINRSGAVILLYLLFDGTRKQEVHESEEDARAFIRGFSIKIYRLMTFIDRELIDESEDPKAPYFSWADFDSDAYWKKWDKDNEYKRA